MKAKIVNIALQAIILFVALYVYIRIDMSDWKFNISWGLICIALSINVGAIIHLVTAPPINPNYDDDEDEEEEGPPPIPPEFSKRKIYEKEEELVC